VQNRAVPDAYITKTVIHGKKRRIKTAKALRMRDIVIRSAVTKHSVRQFSRMTEKALPLRPVNGIHSMSGSLQTLTRSR
jgi:hypothetical protein